MMMIEVILFGFFLTCVCAAGVADVVLSCSLVEDGAGMGRMGPAFTRSPATLVLRDVTVALDDSLETLTPFVPPSVPDPDLILFEAKAVASVEIPNIDVLLHADCNDQEVMCEISHYSPHGAQGSSSDSAHFIVSLDVEGVHFSTSLILQTLAMEKNHTTLMQPKLGLPLSRSGTLLTEVIFLVFSHVTSVSAPLRGDVLLHCGFKQHEILLMQEVRVEWRLQHRGKGRRVLEMRTRMDDADGNTVVYSDRKDLSMDATQVVSEGNASVTLNKLRVYDEGTYICTVTLGRFHAQQVIKLHLHQPPSVLLSEEKLVLKTESSQTLSCHCSYYYPLDAQMEWFYLSPTDTEHVIFPNQGSLSSHRQHGDGTFSLSSHLAVPPTVSPGTKITCVVSHPALDTPLSVSVVVESPQPDSYRWILGFLVITVIFFYQVMK